MGKVTVQELMVAERLRLELSKDRLLRQTLVPRETQDHVRQMTAKATDRLLYGESMSGARLTGLLRKLADVGPRDEVYVVKWGKDTRRSKLIDFQEGLPHVIVPTPDGNAHVLPVSVIERLASGELPVQEVDDWELIVRGVLASWLRMLRGGDP